MQIDFYVTVIDNYWDYWFAFNLAISILNKNKSLKIRFFWDNENLFYDLKWKYDYPNIVYINLNKVKYFVPSEIIFNFFDKKIDFDFLNHYSFYKTVYNLGYLSFEPKIKTFNNTSYTIGKTKIIHIIPSFLSEWWWVIINNLQSITKENISLKFDINQKNLNKKWVSVFVYKDTYVDIIKEIKKNDDCYFFLFDYIWDDNLENIKKMPFLSINDYYQFLSVCDYNIVRWENSFVQAFLWEKPFLWDIYKENNLAHKYKIIDFNNYILNNFWDKNKKYLDIFTKFNLENKPSSFSDFLNLDKTNLFFSQKKQISNIIDNFKELF